MIALLALFPGVLPGALALGLCTGGILGRLVAEAWESVDTRPATPCVPSAREAGSLASVAAIVPPSAHHLTTYTIYRLEICIRETAVVGVVGAGLGRLLGEALRPSVFRQSPHCSSHRSP